MKNCSINTRKNGLRNIAALLALSMIFVFSACGKTAENGKEVQDTPETEIAAVNDTAARTPEEAAKAYMEAEKAGDINKIFSLIPEEVSGYIIANEFEGDKNRLLLDIKEQCLATYLETIEVPNDECGFEFISADDANAEVLEETETVFAEKELAEIADSKDATFKFWIRDDVQEGFIVQLVKIGDKWGVLPFYITDRLAG